ncbi:hypothetical protein [Miltoncostaea marina]|uniref:hypothetical protein n=1 Tax=Miltoncostaea marina TaxID=2843215 RepID=UPI001C3DBF5D|nr:hypothetical protein [Miltoncostaea marina]
MSAGDDARVATARFAWEEGAARMAQPAPTGVARARRRIVTAVHDELRRRVGVTFSTAELAAVYEDAASWYLDLAARVAPREPDAWEPATTLDGAFALYARQATDARR